MIKYIKQKDIDYRKWDECVDQSINGLIYAYSWYLDIVAGKWDALVEDDYKRVMPLPFKNVSIIHKAFQPFFAQQLGVFSRDLPDENDIKRFLEAIPKKFIFIDIALNQYNHYTESSFKKSYRKTFLLDLIMPYEIIRSGYKKNHERNVKKAERSELFYREDSNPDDVILAYRNSKGKQYPNITEEHYKDLKRLIFECVNKGIAQTIKAYDKNNNFCSGVVFFIHGKRIILIFSGATEQSKENGAMFGIIDYIIKKHQQQELVLDFEGSMDENIARFYSGFGAKECLFLQVKKALI
ncbi:MAG: hypothetical protein KGZ97_00125 [Bacteroidetes bacterium]|nr:hypothetical protein [Bacteroidota bacterium]